MSAVLGNGVVPVLERSGTESLPRDAAVPRAKDNWFTNRADQDLNQHKSGLAGILALFQAVAEDLTARKPGLSFIQHPFAFFSRKPAIKIMQGERFHGSPADDKGNDAVFSQKIELALGKRFPLNALVSLEQRVNGEGPFFVIGFHTGGQDNKSMIFRGKEADPATLVHEERQGSGAMETTSLGDFLYGAAKAEYLIVPKPPVKRGWFDRKVPKDAPR